ERAGVRNRLFQGRLGVGIVRISNQQCDLGAVALLTPPGRHRQRRPDNKGGDEQAAFFYICSFPCRCTAAGPFIAAACPLCAGRPELVGVGSASAASGRIVEQSVEIWEDLFSPTSLERR